jgi:hypothetical protein
MTTYYQKQGTDFITTHNLEFRVVHIGHDCPSFCEDVVKGNAMDQVDTWPRKTHIHGHHYNVTISAKDRGHFTIDFWNSYADEFHNWAIKHRMFAMDSISTDYRLGELIKAELRKGKGRFEPTPYDVLTVITKQDPGSFEDFCGDFGYDTDSRKAESVYFAVQKEWSKVRRFFTADEITEMQDIC